MWYSGCVHRSRLTDEATLRDCKLKLLLHPRFEARSMLIRYPVGVGVATLVNALLGVMTELRLVAAIVGGLMLLPITAAFFMFQSELILSRILKEERLVRIVISKDSYRPIQIFPRILFALIAILIPPLTIFISFIILINAGTLHLEHQALHFSIIVSITVGTCIMTAFFLAQSLGKTVKNIETSLDNIADGNLSTKFVPMTTTDEAGSMSSSMNRLLLRIRSILSLIQDMFAELSASSEEMAATASSFTEQNQTSATAVEEITAALDEILANTDSIYQTIEYQHREVFPCPERGH